MSVYFDTSALAKWYLNEAKSEEVEEFLLRECPVGIGLLTKVEMRSLMAERRREDHFDADTQGRILATFEGDIAAGHLILLPTLWSPSSSRNRCWEPIQTFRSPLWTPCTSA